MRSSYHSNAGNDVTTEMLEFVARDSAGRVRIEKRGVFGGTKGAQETILNTRDGKQFAASDETMGVVILVFDLPKGKVISMQPGMRIATVRESKRFTPASAPERPYSSLFMTLLGKSLPPDLSADNLGWKKIEGIEARGIRVTQLGMEKDGEWNGKVISVVETWVSDELSAVMLETKEDFRTGRSSRTSLTHIEQEEPDAALFEIPADYKVNPTPEEMPYTTGQGVTATPKQ